MGLNTPSTILKLCSLGFMIAAGGLWATAGVVTRPKHRDEQTLIGGAIWSQILIPIGMVISSIIKEELYGFIHSYYLMTGSILLALTGILLVYEETKKRKSQRQLSAAAVQSVCPLPEHSFDEIYFAIGILTLIAAVITFADFILTVI